MRTLLIDGDCEAWTVAWHPEDVARRTINHVLKLKRDLSADRVIVCLSDASHRYYRHELWPAYKADRSEPPAELPTAFEAMRLNFQCCSLPALEADDVIGILATGPWLKGERVVVGVDKDLLTIAGTHFNPRRTPRGTVHVSDEQAAFNHMAQTLTGDAGDHYPGCPRVGPHAVRRILWGDSSQWWPQVVCAFKSKGMTEADALVQARIARILRACDYDIPNRRVIPWDPSRLLGTGVAKENEPGGVGAPSPALNHNGPKQEARHV